VLPRSPSWNKGDLLEFLLREGEGFAGRGKGGKVREDREM